MAYRAAVAGASGYLGAELLRLLAGHPELEVGFAGAGAHVGERVGDLFPNLGGAYPDLVFEPTDAAALADYDVAFFALPHGESQNLMPEVVGTVGHVVDLAADFRLPAGIYAQWYGEGHRAPDLIEGFAFGLPELFRKDIIAAEHVAVPGCYPTASCLALAPALEFIELDAVVVDAMSGVSGRGRALSAPSLYAEANENAIAYGLLTHRHTGEIEHALSRTVGGPVQVLFTPHLVPMTRGLLATCHARLRAGMQTETLLEHYRSFYADEPFVRVVNDPPGTKAALGSNSALVTVRVDQRTRSLIAIAGIDNLVKGGSGQAVQSMNLLLDLPEDTGLTITGLAP